MKHLLVLLALGTAILAWTFRSGPSVAGVWQTSDEGILATRPTITLSRAGLFQFDASGRGRTRQDATVARWELKDRAIWIIEEGKRQKLADVAAVTSTSLVLCLAESGVQQFTRIGDGD